MLCLLCAEIALYQEKEGKSAPYGHNTLSDLYFVIQKAHRDERGSIVQFHRIKQKPFAYCILQMDNSPCLFRGDCHYVPTHRHDFYPDGALFSRIHVLFFVSLSLVQDIIS